ncbi:hypothetical protein [Ruegeria atlantica]|uniref:hypothetical protein n=1 Tax=Ruegeria atlantica TaxID=81569 RepID=UPI003F68A54D
MAARRFALPFIEERCEFKSLLPEIRRIPNGSRSLGFGLFAGDADVFQSAIIKFGKRLTLAQKREDILKRGQQKATLRFAVLFDCNLGHVYCPFSDCRWFLIVPSASLIYMAQYVTF